MRIESVKTEPDRAGRFWVVFDDGSRLGLYRQSIEDFSLYPGKELSQHEWESLQESAGQVSAKMRAVRIVAASSVSRQDLQQRLIQKGETPRDAAEAVAWMEEMKLVDDAETARQLVQQCIRKGYGLAVPSRRFMKSGSPKTFGRMLWRIIPI